MDNFFNRSGTMNDALGLANDISSFKSNNSATGRFGALGRIVELVMSLFE